VSDAIIYNQVLSKLQAADDAAKLAVGLSTEAINTLSTLNPTNWATTIPKLDDTGLASNCPDGTSGVFCVWDASYNRCQSSCSWTVPAGVTKVGFQLWGGGGGSSSGCCCGGHPGGSTGEFVSVVMDVTAGETYSLNNECNYCCLGRQGGIQISSAASYISGPGITTLCASGGCGTLCSWSCSIDKGIGIGWSPTASKYVDYKEGAMADNPGGGCFGCRWMYPGISGGTPAGACFCNSGYDYCFSSSCATCGEIPWTISHCTVSPTTIDSARYPTCGNIPKRWNAMCFNTDHYGYVQYAPTVCWGPTGATTQMHPGSDCCFSFSSGNCCGGYCSTASCGGTSAAFGCMPGHGSVFSHAMGGGTSLCGDTGRGAAIRVTYC
jgi:hypothetical protein